MDAFDDVRAAATDAGIDPDAAVRVVQEIAEDRSEPEPFVAEAMIEQFRAGVGLDAAVSALRAADTGR